MVNKDSEKNVSAKEHIAATIAHEIRNPLALIKANLQYVELCEQNSAYKNNYDVIYREIERINGILSQYMDTSKQDRLIKKRFGVTELIFEIEQIFKQALEFAGIKLSIAIIDGAMTICADYNKIKQVLINIIQNAKEGIEQSGKDNRIIEISVFETNRRANICITDNGIGISEDDLKNIGTPFFTKKENGCGLGISISKEILRLHSGSLTINGAERGGASVTISLPLYME